MGQGFCFIDGYKKLNGLFKLCYDALAVVQYHKSILIKIYLRAIYAE